jgi:hypothetical protein
LILRDATCLEHVERSAFQSIISSYSSMSPRDVIEQRPGHESPTLTLKQYAHVLPGMQAEAARSVAALVTGQTDVGDA